MESPLDILLFGDQTGDFITIFQNLKPGRDNVYLEAFLDRSYVVLRHEVSRQPPSVKEKIPGFDSLSDLVARYAEPGASKCNALESALTCVSHLACFFRLVHNP